MALVRPVAAADAGASTEPCQLTASASTSDSTILPGEPLEIAFHLKNATPAALSLEWPSETVGTVQLRIVSDLDPTKPKKYLGPRWAMEDSVRSPRTLPRNASVDLSLRVLFQVRQQPYAFSTAGTYQLRLSYADEPACPEGIEAPLLTVKVMDPRGVDLAVWNAIKDCARCAHLLHTGRAGKNPADQGAVALLRSLVRQYPNNRYAKTFRKQLDALDDREKHEHKDHKPHDD